MKPCLAALGPAWNPAEIASLFSLLMPHLKPDERAEVIASILAKGEYHPFRDGLHLSDIVRDGFSLDAKSVQYRFSYKCRPEEAARQFAAFRATGFLPGLVIVYQGRAKDHRVILMPGLLRPNVSVTLKRVVDRPELWTWNQAKPDGILISQDGNDITKFLTNPMHVSDALNRMEIAMATVAKARKNDPEIDKDWNEISQVTMAAVLKTDLVQQVIATAKTEARKEGITEGRKEGITEGRQAEKREIFLTLCQTMSEAEARRITGYAGS